MWRSESRKVTYYIIITSIFDDSIWVGDNPVILLKFYTQTFLSSKAMRVETIINFSIKP